MLDGVIGVDLGGTKLRAGIVDAEARVHHRTRHSAQGLAQGALLATAEPHVREVLDASGGEVSAVGFGIPALIDPQRGVVTFCNHLPLEGLAFADAMSERLGLPVFADNDANVALLAEHRLGAAQGTRNAMMLTLGTGIGGGVVVEGGRYRGARGGGGVRGAGGGGGRPRPCGPRPRRPAVPREVPEPRVPGVAGERDRPGRG